VLSFLRYITEKIDSQFLILEGKHPYFRDNIFGSQASWLGSHPEASGHESKLYWQVEESEPRNKCIFLAGENLWADEPACLTFSLSRK
jgi:hypothetical protein